VEGCYEQRNESFAFHKKGKITGLLQKLLTFKKGSAAWN
jgi:hypothetical protein